MKYSQQVLKQTTSTPNYMSNSNMVAPQGNTSSTSKDPEAFTPVNKGLKNDISKPKANDNGIESTYANRYDPLIDWLDDEGLAFAYLVHEVVTEGLWAAALNVVQMHES